MVRIFGGKGQRRRKKGERIMKKYLKDFVTLMTVGFTTGAGILCTAVGVKGIIEITKGIKAQQ